MLTKIEVRTSQGALLSLPLDEVTSGFIVEDIEGLDPVNASLVSSSFAQMDGAQYHSSRRETRNIKLKLGLEPDYETNSSRAIRILRQSLYPFFMPKSQVSLRFYIDTGDGVLDDYYVDILGRVETFLSPPFTKEPAVDISLICFDPDFLDPNPVIYEGMSTAGLTEQILDYPGSVESGIILSIRPDRVLNEFTVYHRPPDSTLRILDFSNPLIAGDVIKINTSVGAKSVVRSRGGFDTSLLYALSPQANWLELQPGNNYIRVYAEGAAVPFSIEYTTKYGGL